MSNNKPEKEEATPVPSTNDPQATPVAFRSSTLQSLVRPGTLARSASASAAGGSGFTPSSLTRPKSAAKPKATFQFTPSAVKASTQTRPKPKAAVDSSPAAGMSIQNLLAHRLAVSQTAEATRMMPRRGVPPSRVVSSTLQNKLAQYESMRKSKKRDSKKSREILELSWPSEEKGEDLSIYTPVSLPYVHREDQESTSRKETDRSTTSGQLASKKTQRPSIKNVDEANRNAAILFEEDENVDDVNNWMLVQLPSLLPALDKIAMDNQKEKLEDELLTVEERARKAEEKEKENRRKHTLSAGSMMTNTADHYVPSAFSGLPEGKLGKIVIRRSGKAQMIIGNHTFEVNAGSDCNFAQDVGCYVDSNSEFFFLGRCLKRMNVTPDVELLIKCSRERT